MKKILLNNDVQEIHIPIVFSTADEAQIEFEKAKRILSENGAEIVTLEISAGSFADKPVADFTKDAPYPVNRILPLDEASRPILGGAHITAVSGYSPKFSKTGKGVSAAMYSDGIFDYCRTFGVVSDVDNNTPYEHTLDNLEQIESALNLFDFAYTDIVRTWFYNDDILSWYDDFNKARTKFYSDRKIFDKLLPASTGIGAPNKDGRKIVSGAVALKKIGDGQVRDVESPLQCGAPKYGSSFARAVEIDTPKSRRIMVSGTASIEQNGKTAFVGDIEKQVDLTMKVIAAILESRGLSFNDTIRSFVYCLRPEYFEYFEKWAKKNGAIAHVPSFSIVCRHDLLFEVELEAAKQR